MCSDGQRLENMTITDTIGRCKIQLRPTCNVIED